MKRTFTRLAALAGLTLAAHGSVQAQTILSGEGRLYSRPRLSPFSVEFGAGSAYYTGDMVKPFNISAQNNLLNLSLALGARYQITEFVSIRGTLTYFRLKATADTPDQEWTNADGSPKSFQSNNMEVAFELVHDVLPKSFTEEYRSPINGYLFGGVGGLIFHPRSTQDGSLLEPKHSLPKGDKQHYGSGAFVIPVGFGINYHFFEDSWIGLEFGYRFTNTDFLDDAHAPSYAHPVNDGYYIYGFRASLQLYKGFAVGQQ